MTRLRTILFGWILLAAPATLWAQLPGTGELIKAPKIKLGAGKSTLEKVNKVLGELDEQSQALDNARSDLDRWRDDLEVANGRLAELEQLRTQTVQKVGDAEQADVDPALLPQLGANVDLMHELSDTISFLVETFRQEQNESNSALSQARRLSTQLQEQPLPLAIDELLTLDEAVRYLGDLHMERISLSLLKAQRAGLKEELEQRLKEKTPSFSQPPLAEFAGDHESRQLTLSLRQEVSKKLPQLVAYRDLLRKHVTGNLEAQLQSVRLEIYERSDQLARIEANREQVFSALNIDDEALTAAEERLRVSLERIGDEERKVRREIKQLRMSPPEARSAEVFNEHRLWQAQLTVLQHRLYLVDVERQVEKFRAGSMAALHRLLQGRPPPRGVLQVICLVCGCRSSGEGPSRAGQAP